MDLQGLKNYFNSEDDLIWLYKNFGKCRKNWFQSIFIYITERCQLKCKHCYLGERLKRGSQMSLEQIVALLNLWKGIGAERVCFIGGEPTLHPNYKEAVRYANSLKFEKVIMDTNGIPPSLDVLREFAPSDFAYVQVSLDGASPQTHEIIRGRGTFKNTFNTIKELRHRGFDVRIISTVNKLNVKDCLDILKMAEDIGVSLVKYHICSKEGRCKGNSKMIFSPYEWIEFIKILSKVGKKYKTKILYQPTFANDELGDQYFKEGYSGCIAKQLCKVSIFPDDKMYLCSYLFDTNLNFAEMVNGKITINQKLSELSLLIRDAQNKRCKKCRFAKLCQEGCPAEKVTQGFAICEKSPDIFPICRLWKSQV